MRFYEIHDEEGWLAKTKKLRVAKRSGIAFLAMKRGRKVHIETYTSGLPTASYWLDSTTRTWRELIPVSTITPTREIEIVCQVGSEAMAFSKSSFVASSVDA